jgi:hypothetical protein
MCSSSLSLYRYLVRCHTGRHLIDGNDNDNEKHNDGNDNDNDQSNDDNDDNDYGNDKCNDGSNEYNGDNDN